MNDGICKDFGLLMKIAGSLCSKNKCLDGCPLFEFKQEKLKLSGNCLQALYEHPEKFENFLLSWNEENRAKTREELIKEQYPNIPLGADGVPAICVRHLGYPLYDPKLPVCTLPARYCLYCWTKEVEKK